MKVTFVYPSFEGLGIEYCSAVLKERGHSATLALDPCLFADTMLEVPWLARFFDHRQAVVESVLAGQPDLVAFSVVTDTYRWALATAAEIRKRSRVPIVFGGIHATSVGKVVLEEPCVDFVIRGEGEHALAELADSLQTGAFDPSIRNLGYRSAAGEAVLNPLRPPIEDLDSLPFPDKSLYDGTSSEADFLYVLAASRGCTFACTFCNNSLHKHLYSGGLWMRRRSPANVLAELAAARARYRFEAVAFLDEVFTGDRDWLDEFCERYRKEVGLPYICCVHPQHLDEQIVDRLATSGCLKANVGVQSVDDELRRHVLHRPGSAEEVGRAIRLLKERNISVYAENILGLPGQTEAHLLQTIRFYNRNRPTIVKMYWLSYYPGTEIVQAGLDSGELVPDDLHRLERGLGTRPFTAGGTRARPEFHRLFVLLVFLLWLPVRFVDWFLDRRLHRFLPAAGFARCSGLLMHLVNYDRSEREFHKRRLKRHYRHTLVRWLRARTCQRATAASSERPSTR